MSAPQFTPERARALFLDHCQPGDRGTLERYGERAAVAAMMTVVPGLYEALEPFAKLGGMLDGPFAPALFKDGDAVGIGGAWSENGETRTITFGDLRRAASALAKVRGEQ